MCWWIRWDIHTRTLIYRLFPTASSTTIQQTCKSLCMDPPALNRVTQHTRTARSVWSLRVQQTWSCTSKWEEVWVRHRAWRDLGWGLELGSGVRMNSAWCVGTKLQDTTTMLWPVKAAKVISWFVLLGVEKDRQMNYWLLVHCVFGYIYICINDC